MTKEKNDIENKQGNKALELKNWDKISINNDQNGKLLISGTQTETALGLGMIAQD